MDASSKVVRSTLSMRRQPELLLQLSSEWLKQFVSRRQVRIYLPKLRGDLFALRQTHHRVVLVKKLVSQEIPDSQCSIDGFLSPLREIAPATSNPIQHLAWLLSDHLLVRLIESLFLQFAASYAEKIQNLDHFAFKNLRAA